jgi:hypothetical protein
VALARAVLRAAADLPGEWTRLALEVRDADPSWAAKAVTLAAMVLETASEEHTGALNLIRERAPRTPRRRSGAQ